MHGVRHGGSLAEALGAFTGELASSWRAAASLIPHHSQAVAREESERHQEYRSWLHRVLDGPGQVGLFEPVLAAVLRIATHPKIYRTPAPRAIVESFLDGCLTAPAAVALRADARHWSIFRSLCTEADCRGHLVQDAYLAALALEHNCTYMTTDRDFARFPRLRWQHPLDHAKPIRN